MRRLLILAILFTSFAARAEPGPTINWLMNEPMSLWDWGVVSLREEAESVRRALGSLRHDLGVLPSSAHYDFSDNRINIHFRAGSNSSDPQLIEGDCAFAWNGIVGLFTAFHDGDSRESKAANLLEGHFSHPGGYKVNSRPEDIGLRLSRITYVILEYSVADAENEIKIECFGRIIDEEPSYRRIPAQ